MLVGVLNNCFLGISVTESDHYIIGENVSLNCTTDLGVELEWVWYGRNNGTAVVTSSGNPVVLELSPVTASMHGTIYGCRAISTYGVPGKAVTVEVQGSHYY